MIDLHGKVALVTGSSRGIGRACALRLAEAGADIVVNYVTSGREADAVAAEIAAMGRRVACIRADVGEEEDVEDMIGFVREQFGALDIVVHNAATGGFRPLAATSQRHFDAAMHTNVLSLVHLLKAAAPLLESGSDRGKVVVLDFWYRGCGWCIRAMPQMKQLADDFSETPDAVEEEPALGREEAREIGGFKNLAVVVEVDRDVPLVAAERIGVFEFEIGIFEAP